MFVTFHPVKAYCSHILSPGRPQRCTVSPLRPNVLLAFDEIVPGSPHHPGEVAQFVDCRVKILQPVHLHRRTVHENETYDLSNKALDGRDWGIICFDMSV